MPVPRQLQHETDVLVAIRGLLHPGLNEDEAVGAMDSLVAETSRLSLINLGAWERKIREELRAIERRPSPVGWKFWEQSTRVNSWLTLCSDSGFERERSLRALSVGGPNGFFCSLAMRRLNDWVPQVRAAARAYVPLLAQRTDPEYVVDALWITLPHWNSWGRTEEADIEVLTALIATEQVALALKSRIQEATVGPATSILAQAMRTPALDQWLGEISQHAVQPSVRARAFRSQLDERTVWVSGRKWIWTDKRWCKGRFEPTVGERSISTSSPFLVLLRTALADRSSIVRRVAGEFLIRHLEAVGTEAFSLAERLASDPSPYVAQRGRFALSRLSGHA